MWFEIRNNSFKLSSVDFFFMKTLYGLSRKLPFCHKCRDETAIYLAKARVSLDVNTFQR